MPRLLGKTQKTIILMLTHLALAIGWLHERWELETRFTVWKERHFQSLVEDKQHLLREIKKLREENSRLSIALAMLSEDHGDNDEQESGLIIFPRRDQREE